MVVVSLDMFLNNIQDTFVRYKNDKFCLIKGNKNSGKTISTIFKTLYLKRNYCFEITDKILFLTSKLEYKNVIDIFNYINKSDLYKSIIPSDDIEVCVLTYDDFINLKMNNMYTHILIDNIEDMDEDKIKNIFLNFKNLSYSKVCFAQNSLDNIESVNNLIEYTRKIVGVREFVFKFRYVIDDGDRDEFTQITMNPNIKYSDYIYREYVDFEIKKISSYYDDCRNLYIDRGTFLQNMTKESLDICFLDRDLRIRDYIKILKEWINYDFNELCFVEIDDEGMGKYDLFRGDIVLIEKKSSVGNNQIVAILKDKRIYVRKFISNEAGEKFISGESIFKEIPNDESVVILGKVVGYIRQY